MYRIELATLESVVEKQPPTVKVDHSWSAKLSGQ
jgi:hypothetical protein